MIRINAIKRIRTSNGDQDLNYQLEVLSGKIVAVFGSSGIGKTTLFRILAGLDRPEKGSLKVKDQVWVGEEASAFLAPQQRNLAMAFQDPSLFPHLSVEANIRFGKPPHSGDELIEELVEVMGLSKLLDRFPEQLSGGQQQRVSLARAIAAQADLLLLDEPFNGLDASLKDQIISFLKVHQKKNGFSLWFISHSIPDVFKCADLVVNIREDFSQHLGRPEEIFGQNDYTGNFSQQAEVLKIEQAGVVFLVTVCIGDQVFKLVTQEEVASGLSPGDLVSIQTKAFSPVIQKLRKS